MSTPSIPARLRHRHALAPASITIAAVMLVAGCSSGTTPTDESSAELGDAYIVNTGGVDAGLPDAGPSLSVVDRSTGQVSQTIELPNDGDHAEVGHFVNISADGTQLWLGTRSDETEAGHGTVRAYDLAALHETGVISYDDSDAIQHSFDVGSGVQNVSTPDGRFLFTSSEQGTKGINIFDTETGEFIGNIPNDNTSPHSGAVSPDGKTYYTTTAEKHHVVGYDISGLPDTVPSDADRVLDLDIGYGSLHAFDIDPTGNYLFVGNSDWQIPEGATPRSGVNIIDISTGTPTIVATVPGRPHNFTISADGTYLASTELKAQAKANDCDAGAADLGNRLQFIDVSTLQDADPDYSTITEVYSYDTPGFGGSHAIWDEATGWLYYTVIDNESGQGYLHVLDTSTLDDASPSVSTVLDAQEIGWNPHGLVIPGRNGR
ncbi:hypothetical protein GCM10009785_22370 [Brooklawnia cerclae]|uniref:DNA-binding beta-propeller fold protein YncE n=1 Tax=Brooklawnia cerclae TaxID=349934 RepID=A0ABX0SFK8_9ACTN|nr:hypothetical protein [Brooklawnia cerclae]NIH57129.1 DNA-binding beta-propeller fold protein YncE [Brooklawnia cerclae]